MTGMAAVLAGAAPAFNMALAQDDVFLACGQHSDRGQRIACLEDALEAAMAARSATPAQPAPSAASNPNAVVTRAPAAAIAPAPAVATATAPAIAPVSTPARAIAPAPVSAEPTPLATVSSPENDQSLLDRLRNFGQRETASVSADEDGQEQLNDTITKLEKRNNLWIVTLSSGQVWRQEFPRTLNLREGDQISIYQAGLGNGYRLAAKRLSGFIRVERLQ